MFSEFFDLIMTIYPFVRDLSLDMKYKQFYIGDINQDMIKSASYNCRFEIPQVKERKKPKKKKSGAKKLLEKIIGD